MSYISIIDSLGNGVFEDEVSESPMSRTWIPDLPPWIVPIPGVRIRDRKGATWPRSGARQSRSSGSGESFPAAQEVIQDTRTLAGLSRYRLEGRDKKLYDTCFPEPNAYYPTLHLRPN